MSGSRRSRTWHALTIVPLTSLGLVAAACASVSSVAAPDPLDGNGIPLITESVPSEPADGETIVSTPTDGENEPAADAEATPTTEPPTDPPSDDPEPPPAPETPPWVPVRTPVVVNTYPHDATAFTQGLELVDGVLIESVGIRGESGRRRVVPSTGEVSASVGLDPSFFGAGLTVVDNTIYQLTLEAGQVIVADPTTLQEFDRVAVAGAGWGLCALDDSRLARSNGTPTITFLELPSLQPTGSVEVTLDGQPLSQLNELECVNGKIWANVWLTSEIVQIDATSGVVLQRIDASALVPDDVGVNDVLNGIAYNAAAGTFYVTGKRWAALYEVDLGPT